MSPLDAIQGLDEAILHAARGSPCWAVPLFYVFTLIGAGWGLVVFVPFLVNRTTRLTTTWLLVATAATSTAVSLVKLAVGRVRPCEALAWCAPIHIGSPGGGSFPSGHAAGSFAVAAFVMWRSPRLGSALLVYAAIVAWSRCVLGVHYPSDVLAGSLLGAAIASAFALELRRRELTGASRSESQSRASSPSPAGDTGTPG